MGRTPVDREGLKTENGVLARHLDATVVWSSLENRPCSRLSGRGQRLRGVRSGIPDTIFMARGLPSVFIELKSRGGALSAEQKKIAAELVAVGRLWFMARSARACLLAVPVGNLIRLAREAELRNASAS